MTVLVIKCDYFVIEKFQNYGREKTLIFSEIIISEIGGSTVLTYVNKLLFFQKVNLHI